jgi:putative peptide zinc metalloprotease protein
MTTLIGAPTRVAGVELIGQMVGSGYRSPPALVRRADGQVLQLTPLLYEVLDAADGRRSCAEIADLIGWRLRRTVTERDVRMLVDGHLRPLGLLHHPDGSEPELRRADPLLRLKPRVAITNPRSTRRLTDPFRLLFRPVVAVAVVAGFLAVVAWVFFDRGLGASAYDAFQRPHLLLLVSTVAVLSGGFHEFGHAAAARYGGAEPGAMGAGLYLVWPAFYTDVTDSYRLGKAGRIRTDLGGLYFNAVVVVLTFAWWWTTRWEAVLLLVAVQVLQMVQQLLPLLRFDGYHVLADLAGVPDLYHRIKPTLLGLLPHRWRAPENRVLTPWARFLITLWVLVTLPMMALMMLALVRAVPRLLGSAGSVLREDAAAVSDAWSAGSAVDIAAHAVEVLGVVLPMMAGAMVLGRIGFRFFRGLSRWSQGSPVKRIAAAALTSTLITALCWAWWPNPGTYEPIKPGERGLFTELVPLPVNARADNSAMPAASGLVGPGSRQAGLAAQDRLSGDQRLVAAFEKGEPLPTKDDPVLAMVLVPADNGGTTASSTADILPDPDPGSGPPDDTWVFPFDKPLPPAEGDNQALAVNKTDGSVTYDLAFALVWAEGDEVLNVNEAHAYASCSDCVAVAVAFQVVLIMDDAQVVVPQNLAVSANYDCYRCITAAIASQLVLSVTTEPGQEQLRALGEVWNRLTQFAGTITSYSLTDITVKLQAFKAEIVAILGTAPPVTPGPSTAATPTTTTATTSASPVGTSSPSPTQQPSSTPSPTQQPSSSPSPTQESTTGTPSPTQESTTGTPSPTQESTASSLTSTPLSTPEATETSPSTTAPSTTSPSTTAAESTSPTPTSTTSADAPPPTSTTAP